MMNNKKFAGNDKVVTVRPAIRHCLYKQETQVNGTNNKKGKCCTDICPNKRKGNIKKLAE